MPKTPPYLSDQPEDVAAVLRFFGEQHHCQYGPETQAAVAALLAKQRGKQDHRLLRIFQRWLKIRAYFLEGQDALVKAEQLGPDMDHSTLLRRLMEGKQPLPLPPPKSYSYPWYTLVEKGEAVILERFVNRVPAMGEMPEGVVIEQGWWVLRETYADGTLVIATADGFNVAYLKLEPDGWHLTLRGQVPPPDLETARMARWAVD